MPFAMTSTWFDTSDLLSGSLIQLVCHTMSVKIANGLCKAAYRIPYSYQMFNSLLNI